MKRMHVVFLAAVALSATTVQGQQRMASGVAPATAPTAVRAVVHAASPSVFSTARATPNADRPSLLDAPAGGFASSGFAQFMASPAGRVLRVVAGAGMIAGGISMDSNAGTALAVVGAVPLSAGLFDICWLSPILGGPLKGKDIRAAK
jgi:hypothetical protein